MSRYTCDHGIDIAHDCVLCTLPERLNRIESRLGIQKSVNAVSLAVSGDGMSVFVSFGGRVDVFGRGEFIQLMRLGLQHLEVEAKIIDSVLSKYE